MPTSMDSLPVELRLKIYRNLMLLDPIKLTSRKADGNGSVYNFNAYNIQYSRSYIFRASGQLVRVSRLYYREATSVLYGENLFIAGLRDHTLSFVKEPTKLGVQVFRDVANMRFDGLQNLQHRYGLAVLSTLPRLSNLFLYGEFTYFKDNTGAIEKTWDEVIGGALRAGTVVKNNSKIHNAFAALPQAAMDRFEERGTTITCIAKIASGQTQINEFNKHIPLVHYYKFESRRIHKKRVKAEKLTLTYDIVFKSKELEIEAQENKRFMRCF